MIPQKNTDILASIPLTKHEANEQNRRSPAEGRKDASEASECGVFVLASSRSEPIACASF
jgi:hypothetical protein